MYPRSAMETSVARERSRQRRSGPRPRLSALSLRGRVLAWFLALLLLAVGGTVLALRAILVDRLDQRVNQELTQEVGEFRTAAQDITLDDVTLQETFQQFLARTVTARHEVIVTFVDGRPYALSAGAPADFDRHPAVADLASLTATTRTTVEVDQGRAEVLAVPIETTGTSRGVLAVLIFTDPQLAEIDNTVVTVAAVAAGLLLVAGLGAWVASGRALRPVRDLTDLAGAIDERDLTQRITLDERATDDEVGRLAATFNGMLDRLEHAFTNQQRLLGDIGHELRTPLSVVQGHLDVMGDDPIERKATVELVADELDRMNRLVSDLILLARLEQPGASLHPEDVELLDLATDVVARAHLLADRSWSVAVDVDGTFRADRQRLIQALMNLVTNAIDHTGDGGTIVVGGHWSPDRTRLWVQDDGPGVAEVDRDRIFHRFARGSTADQRPGTGLGLSIVAGIAEAHGGTVALADGDHPGARFTLALPTTGPEPS